MRRIIIAVLIALVAIKPISVYAQYDQPCPAGTYRSSDRWHNIVCRDAVSDEAIRVPRSEYGCPTGMLARIWGRSPACEDASGKIYFEDPYNCPAGYVTGRSPAGTKVCEPDWRSAE